VLALHTERGRRPDCDEKEDRPFFLTMRTASGDLMLANLLNWG
jgi:hypothetical protein